MSLIARAAVTALALLALAPAAALARGPAVIVDTDMDFDDTAALAYLGQADRLGMIDLRAVTVEISGAVAPCGSARSEGLAAELFAASVLLGGDHVDVIALGPLTNVAEALRRYPFIAAGIDHVYVQGGDTTGSPGPDFNFWADPSAAQAVLAALPGKLTLTGANATRHVLMTSAFRNRLAADARTPAARIVSAIASNPIIIGASDGNGAFWWDPLDAVGATVPGVVTYAPLRISIGDDGSTIVDPRGTRISFATDADQARFEDTFLRVLNG
jgi:purine nucleosidase